MATPRYMPVEQRDRFTNDVLTRIGNTLHSFEGGNGDGDGDGDGEVNAGTRTVLGAVRAEVVVSVVRERNSPSRSKGNLR